MLQDYPITNQPTKTSKLVAYIEFIAVLLLIQSVLFVFSQELPTNGAVQFRILANSNTVADQRIKQKVQEEIAPLVERAVNQSTTMQEMNDRLQLLTPELIELASLQTKGVPVTIEYGPALIPPKRVGIAFQPQDVYEAYVVKIGSGKGDNWWCALFPDVCFPEEAAVVETDDKRVTFFLWEWIKSWFS